MSAPLTSNILSPKSSTLSHPSVSVKSLACLPRWLLTSCHPSLLHFPTLVCLLKVWWSCISCLPEVIHQSRGASIMINICAISWAEIPTKNQDHWVNKDQSAPKICQNYVVLMQTVTKIFTNDESTLNKLHYWLWPICAGGFNSMDAQHVPRSMTSRSTNSARSLWAKQLLTTSVQNDQKFQIMVKKCKEFKKGHELTHHKLNKREIMSIHGMTPARRHLYFVRAPQIIIDYRRFSCLNISLCLLSVAVSSLSGHCGWGVSLAIGSTDLVHLRVLRSEGSGFGSGI